MPRATTRGKTCVLDFFQTMQLRIYAATAERPREGTFSFRADFDFCPDYKPKFGLSGQDIGPIKDMDQHRGARGCGRTRSGLGEYALLFNFT